MLQTYVGTRGMSGQLKHNETFKTLQIGISIYDKDAGCKMQEEVEGISDVCNCSIFCGIRELPVNNLPILIISIDTDFTDLHRCYCPDY